MEDPGRVMAEIFSPSSDSIEQVFIPKLCTMMDRYTVRAKRTNLSQYTQGEVKQET
jgi:hypothetical protein